MADKISPAARSWNMSRIRSKAMKPELLVRSLVHGMGYRYRLHRKDLPGKPDLVFGPRRKVIFVHGCFWHQHDALSCKIQRKPKSNTEYWNAKLEGNVVRDTQHTAALSELGWGVLVIWECETRDVSFVERCIENFLT